MDRLVNYILQMWGGLRIVFKRPAETTGHVLLRRVEITMGMIKCNFQKVKIMTQTNIK